MNEYELTYKQPHEYDDGSPSGIGDHGISYSTNTFPFIADNDKAAITISQEFLSGGALNFGSHIGSPTAGIYPRQFVSLYEVYTRKVLVKV